MGEVGHNNPPRASNWIAVDRDVRFHPIVGFLDDAGKPRKGVVVCEMVAWLDLVMEANWKDRSANNKGKVMVIERGQLMAARNWLAKRWGWTEDKVRWFFRKLQEDGMISFPAPKITQPVIANRTQSNTQKRAHFANVITICNYNVYQAACELDALLSTQSNTHPTPNQHPHLNKETKKQETTQSASEKFDRSNEGVIRLQNQLLDACNGAADPANAPGLLSMGEPIRWIESGCDLELDIVPTIKARAHKAPPRSIRSWSYFTQAVADAKAKRLTPMPVGNVKPGQAGEESLDAMIARHRRHYGGVL